MSEAQQKYKSASENDTDKQKDSASIEQATAQSKPEPSSAQKTDKPDIDDKNDDISEEKILESIAYAHLYIRECLQKSFNSETIRSFYTDNFVEAYGALGDEDRLNHIIRKIMDSCYHNGKYNDFWKKFKRAQPDRYKEYFPRWEKLAKNLPKTEQIDLNTFALSNIEIVVRGLPQENQSNPLDRSSTELQRWFFQESPDAQSTLLSVALFEGMSQHKLERVFADIEEILS